MSASQRTLLSWAEAAVRRCRPTALGFFSRISRLRVERKADGSPVTRADRAVEAQLRRAIEHDFPGEQILGEEYGASSGDRSAYWTIDPIDGTRAFSRGLPSWGIMLGRVERGVATLGVCDFPAVGVTMAAARGVRGYERAGTRVTRFPAARPVASLDQAVIFHGGAGWMERTPVSEGFRKLVERCYLERAYGDCYGYLWAFRGHADAVLDYGVKPWDLVPLAALASGTGRRLTDFSGRDSFAGPETLMAHPADVPRIVRILGGREAIGAPKGV